MVGMLGKPLQRASLQRDSLRSIEAAPVADLILGRVDGAILGAIRRSSRAC